MRIIKERTRIIFSEYTDIERIHIEDLVGTVDKVFCYEDKDKHIICIPTGMERAVRATFPKVPMEDHSDTYWNYATIQPVEHNAKPRNKLQEDFIEFVLKNAKEKRKIAGILSPGTGKMEPISRRIPTPSGYKLMGDLQIGDTIFGSNGSQIHVTNIFDHGEQDIYKVTFVDGRMAYCGADHLWYVERWYRSDQTHQWIPEVRTTRDLMNDPGLARRAGKTVHYKYRVPNLSAPVQYEHRDVPMDPFIYGILISSAFRSPANPEEFVTVSTIKEGIAQTLASHFRWNYYQLNSKRFQFYNDHNYGIRYDQYFPEFNEFLTPLEDRKMRDCYLYNDLHTRMEVLRGLLYARGTVQAKPTHGVFKLTHSSKQLVAQTRQLLLSIGFKAGEVTHSRSAVRERFLYSSNLVGDYDQIKELIVDPKILEIIGQYTWNSRYIPWNSIKSIEFSHREEARCIEVDAPDELYLTEDFVVTHNTFMACYSAIQVGLRTLIIVPTSGIKVQWGDTLTNMFGVDPSRVKVINSPQEFVNVTADFVVISQASLASINNKYDLEGIMKSNKFGIKVIDEVQMWFHNIIKVDGNSNICHNWYLTGTFGRSGEEENALYQQMFSDLAMFREEEKQPTLLNPKPGNVYGMKPYMNVYMMWGNSGISREEIRRVSNSIRYSERAGKWMRYGISIPSYTELIIPSDGTRTKFFKDILKVIKMAEQRVSYGRTLVLGSTINTVEILADAVREMFPYKKIGTYHSRNSTAVNAKNKETCDILISTTSSCGTGFDMKDLSKLVVFAAYKSWILTDQISGRLRRRPDEKDVYMWDIVDAAVPQLRAWANARADVLRRKSKSFKVIDL